MLKRIRNRKAVKKSTRLKNIHCISLILILSSGESSAVSQNLKLLAKQPGDKSQVICYQTESRLNIYLDHLKQILSAKRNQVAIQDKRLTPKDINDRASEMSTSEQDNKLVSKRIVKPIPEVSTVQSPAQEMEQLRNDSVLHNKLRLGRYSQLKKSFECSEKHDGKKTRQETEKYFEQDRIFFTGHLTKKALHEAKKSGDTAGADNRRNKLNAKEKELEEEKGKPKSNNSDCSDQNNKYFLKNAFPTPPNEIRHLEIRRTKESWLETRRQSRAQNDLSVWKSRKLLANNYEDVNNQSQIEVLVNRLSGIFFAICPCADFCFANASKELAYGRKPSCKSCYCDPDCGKRLDCCLESLDFYKIVAVNKMECISPIIKTYEYEQSNEYDVLGYHMITECLKTGNSCRADISLKHSLLFPVYSTSSDTIFYNRKCAECNGVFDSVDWLLYISCKADVFVPISMLFTEPITYQMCGMIFLPPKKTNVEKYVCYDQMIGICNVTGKWDVHDHDIQQACEAVNAPVLLLGTTYANTFCALCNNVDISLKVCNLPKPRFMGFSAMLDYQLILDNIPKNENQDRRTRKSFCDKLEVRNAYKDECRKVFCPSIALRIDSGCEVFVNVWQTNGYTIHVILTPVSKEDLIPLSAFANLSEKQQQNRKLWFDSAGVPLHRFILFASVLEMKNISYANYLDVEIGSKTGPVFVKKALRLVSSAMKKIWKIRLDKTYNYKASFSKFVHRDTTKIITPYATYIKEKPLISENMLVSFDDLFYGYMGGISISKVFYCEQVELKSHEWIRDIFNVVSLNLTTEVIGFTKLGDGEYDYITPDNGESIIRICVDDFIGGYYINQGISSGTCTFTFMFALLNVFSCFT